MRLNRLFIGFLTLALVGCAHAGGAGEGTEETEGFGEPDWIERGNVAVNEKDDQYFAGVGAARDRLRPPLLKRIAREKAMDALEKPLKEYLGALAGPWIKSLDKKTAEEAKPDKMLKALLGRILKKSAVDEVYLRSDEKAAFALARIDLMAVLMEIEASGDTEPMRAYLMNQGADPKVLFARMAAAGAGEEPPAPDEAPPAEEGEGEGEPATE